MQDADFEKLVDEYAPMVFNLSLSYLQQKEDAEEVVQDVFMKVHRHLYSFNNQSSFKTWLYRITINQCLDVLRKKKQLKRPKILGDNIESIEGFFHATRDFNHPGILLENKEGLERLFGRINELPEIQKQALLLKYVEDLSVAEISEVLKKSDKACESLLSRARKNLSDQMKSAKDVD